MLLKLRHWQLFILTWGISIASIILCFFNLGFGLTILPLALIFGTIIYFGWLWQITNYFYKHDSIVNIKLFRMLMPLPVLYLLVLECWILYLIGFGNSHFEHLDPRLLATIIAPLHLISLLIITWAVMITAMCLKVYEINQDVSFQQYASEFLLLWFSVIGFWYLQPRINDFVSQKESRLN